jgi:hypothetical protein
MTYNQYTLLSNTTELRVSQQRMLIEDAICEVRPKENILAAWRSEVRCPFKKPLVHQDSQNHICTA